MHKYQPRLRVLYRPGKGEQTEGVCLYRTFIFPETKFMAVTAYQNQSVSPCKILCERSWPLRTNLRSRWAIRPEILDDGKEGKIDRSVICKSSTDREVIVKWEEINLNSDFNTAIHVSGFEIIASNFLISY